MKLELGATAQRAIKALEDVETKTTVSLTRFATALLKQAVLDYPEWTQDEAHAILRRASR